MTTDQKAAAINALSELTLHIRAPGNWYATCNVEIGGNGMLAGAMGNGGNPYAAVESLWRSMVDELPADRFLVVKAYSKERQQVRWSGFMWEPVS